MTKSDTNELITSAEDCFVGNFTVDNMSRSCIEKGKMPLDTKVHCVQMFQTKLLWSKECFPAAPNVPSGEVSMLMDSGKIDIKRPNLAYTHPNIIKSFICMILQNTSIVMTAGSEGLIGMWRYDASGSFVHVAWLEGHTRDVNFLLHRNIAGAENKVWSASSDHSIICWDVSTCRMEKHFDLGNTHTAEVNCLEMIITDMPYICSGGNDGLFKIWQAESGTCEFTIQEVAPVNALTFFDDETGQNQYAMIAIGLQNGYILMRNLNDGYPILWQLDNRT